VPFLARLAGGSALVSGMAGMGAGAANMMTSCGISLEPKYTAARSSKFQRLPATDVVYVF